MENDESYIKLKTKGILDLDQISKEFRIPVQEIVNFHNNHCKVSEHLTISFHKYLDFIYFPKSHFVKRDNELLKSSSLTYLRREQSSEYGIIIKNLPKGSEIHYKIKIQQKNETITINKTKTFLNNNEIEQPVELIFEKADECLYPLNISTFDTGEIKNIINDKEIQLRWQNELPKLKEYFQSNKTDNIFRNLNFAFQNLNDRINMLEKSTFYKLFFLPIYHHYQNFQQNDNFKIHFPSINQDILYNAVYTLNHEYTHDQKILLTIRGTEIEDIYNVDQPKGKLELTYKLDKHTHEILSILGILSTFKLHSEIIIDFQLYKLNNFL